MLTLSRARFARGAAGEPLPTAFPSIAAENVHIRRGQLSLLVAAPGVGKTLFALKTAIKSNVPALYMSADTDAFTMHVRAAAMLTGYTTLSVEESIAAGNTRTIDATLDKLSHIRFDFSGRIEVEHLERQVKAYAYTYGEYPHAVYIDNLSNFDTEDGGEGYHALESACDYLHELARDTGAAVVALHHATGTYDDGNIPIPQSGLRGKVSKVPELILTLHKDADTGTTGAGRMHVCPVKNRTGTADPSGAFSIPLRYEPGRMLLTDLQKIPA